MTAPAVCVAPDTTVRRAASGIITTADMLDGEPTVARRRRRAGRSSTAPHRKRRLATGVW